MRNNFPVHVIAVGPFGRATAAALSELLPDVQATTIGDDGRTSPEAWPVARAHVLASWRPCHSLCRAVDESCYFWNAVFLPVTLASPSLTVGPVVVPGAGSCFSCYEKRLLQHSQRPKEQRALLDYYDANPLAGPRGFLAVLADIAAVRASQILSGGAESCQAVAGQVWQLDILSRNTAYSRVTGVHGCPRCGLKRDERTRSYSDMRRDLAWLWTPAPEQPRLSIAADPVNRIRQFEEVSL